MATQNLRLSVPRIFWLRYCLPYITLHFPNSVEHLSATYHSRSIFPSPKFCAINVCITKFLRFISDHKKLLLITKNFHEFNFHGLAHPRKYFNSEKYSNYGMYMHYTSCTKPRSLDTCKQLKAWGKTIFWILDNINLNFWTFETFLPPEAFEPFLCGSIFKNIKLHFV